MKPTDSQHYLRNRHSRHIVFLERGQGGLCRRRPTNLGRGVGRLAARSAEADQLRHRRRPTGPRSDHDGLYGAPAAVPLAPEIPAALTMNIYCKYPQSREGAHSKEPGRRGRRQKQNYKDNYFITYSPCGLFRFTPILRPKNVPYSCMRPNLIGKDLSIAAGFSR